jgi:hypothetical protein
VGGIVGTTFNITVYNVGTSNGSAYSMTAAGNTFTGLGITPGTAAPAAVTNLSKFSSTSSNTGTSVFLAAVATATGSFSAQLFSIVGSASTSGVTISLTGTASVFTTQGTIYSLGCTCLSVDTTANAAFYSTGNTSATTLYIWQQTSLTAVSTANTSTMTIQNSATVHGINRTLQWGDNRAVIIGFNNLLAVLSSPNNSTTITSTTMIPATESTTAGGLIPQWFPFDTRPLYTLYDPSSVVPQRVSQFYSRSALANPVTDVGTLTYTGNYFTYGHEYTQTSGWSDVANCWIAGLGGRIYALDAYGNILSEVSLYKLYGPGWTYIQSIRKLAVTTSGRIIAVGSYSYGTDSNSNLLLANTSWSSYTNNLSIVGTNVLSNPQQLSILGNTIATAVSAFMANSLTFASIDNTGTSETLYLTAVATIATPVVVIFKIVSTISTVGAAYSTSVSSTSAGSWNVGPRCNIVLIHDSVQGQYRLVGATGTSSLLNTGYLYITSTPYIETNFTSLSLGFLLSTGTPTGYALTFKSSPTLTTVALFDPTLLQGRIFHSAYGRAMQDWHTGYITNVSGNARYAIIGASKYANAISFANTGTTVPSTASNVYVFDSITLDSPKQITNGYISSVSWCNIRQTGKVTFQVNGMGIDQQNTMSGPSDTAKVFIELFDGFNTFTIGTPGGQPISTSGQLRTVEQYLIPYGYQLRLYTDTPNSVSTLVSVVEE